MTFTTVGFPCFHASVKKTVPTAEPRTVACAVRCAALHLQACIVGRASRQCGMRDDRLLSESDAKTPRTPKALCAKSKERNRFGFAEASHGGSPPKQRTEARARAPAFAKLRLGKRSRERARVRERTERRIDATTNGMLISLFTLCVAPSAGLVMTKSSIPVSRGIVRAFAAAANV